MELRCAASIESPFTGQEIVPGPPLATRYTAAWCSQEAAQGFMTAFPDMVVTMDSLGVQGNHAVYRWTLTGTIPDLVAATCAGLCRIPRRQLLPNLLGSASSGEKRECKCPT